MVEADGVALGILLLVGNALGSGDRDGWALGLAVGGDVGCVGKYGNVGLIVGGRTYGVGGGTYGMVGWGVGGAT